MTSDQTSERTEWIALVNALMDDVQRWAEAHGWFTHRDTKELKEAELGRYSLPILYVRHPGGRLVFDPIARFVRDAQGRIDIEVFPDLRRMIMLRENGEWRLETDAGIAWPEPWGEETFQEIAKSLTAA